MALKENALRRPSLQTVVAVSAADLARILDISRSSAHRIARKFGHRVVGDAGPWRIPLSRLNDALGSELANVVVEAIVARDASVGQLSDVGADHD
jgi:hypothetical protein